MKFIFYYFVSLILLIEVNAQTDCIVKGRVVDINGNPLSNAEITLLPQNIPNYLHIISTSTSDKEGKFRTKQNSSKKIEHLYVTYPGKLEDSVSVLSPPFIPMSKYDMKFSGIPINFGKMGCEVDIGDISPQLYYGRVEITLKTEDNRNKFTTFQEWRNIELIVYDKKNKIAEYQSFSINNIEKAVKLIDAKISLRIPEGKWFVKMIYNNQLHSDKHIIEVSKEKFLNRTIIMK